MEQDIRPFGHRTCTLCNSLCKPVPVNFIDDGKLWRIEQPMCVNVRCLSTRGATFVEHRSGQR